MCLIPNSHFFKSEKTLRLSNCSFLLSGKINCYDVEITSFHHQFCQLFPTVFFNPYEEVTHRWSVSPERVALNWLFSTWISEEESFWSLPLPTFPFPLCKSFLASAGGKCYIYLPTAASTGHIQICLQNSRLSSEKEDQRTFEMMHLPALEWKSISILLFPEGH